MNQYEIIYADPPWKYGSKGARSGKFGELPYPSMTIKEMCQLKVPAHDDCFLFMWATSPFMMDANKVADAWGFKYIRVDSVWCKTKGSGSPHGVCGPHGMTDAEYLLLFGKGNYMSLYNGNKKNQYTVVTENYTGKHSQKPSIFRERIDEKVKNGLNRLEMFARTAPLGWHVWGNEVECDVMVES
ncbi:DNA methyltransferase [Carboxylicivirga sediminis]|uniref:DNA methyltransferase n=1 Tax=Carboxylicivirga sediminis TaxID=2006564 RepID=A0A941IVY5_9BACT|nr:MT-A70 family methyltransferase [Carboxylicivirga sediminis]MBR8535426.1 DNA methyltransferase [Carboxylicivirga sediminis]